MPGAEGVLHLPYNLPFNRIKIVYIVSFNIHYTGIPVNKGNAHKRRNALLSRETLDKK
jgi:hypothetical protein